VAAQHTAITIPTLGRNSVRSASTMLVGTMLLTGKRATAHQRSPKLTPGARRLAATIATTVATRSARPSNSWGPRPVDATISFGE